MMVTDLQPASIVEDKGFLDLLKVLDPKYTVPSRRTIMRDRLPIMYESKKQELYHKLQEVEFCCLTTDLWTSKATMGFMTVTCHYISKEWSMESVILETIHIDVAHTSENLAAALKTVTDEWNINSKVHCVITDNASNIKGAIRINKWDHLACFAHTLNLIVTCSIEKVQEVSSVVQEVKNIVSFFHKSSKASDKLKLIQARLNIPEHKLVQHVQTRWNSSYYMLERYLEQNEAIRTTLCILDRNDLIITTNKNSLLEEIVSILKPFEDVTREMSGEKYVSASKIIPLSKALQHFNTSHTCTSSLKDMLTQEMNMEGNQLLASATIIDPRFKKIPFSDRNAAERVIRQTVTEVSSHTPAGSTETDTTSSFDEPSTNSVWHFFDQQAAESARRPQSITALTEIQQYIKTPLLGRKEDPLLWWKANSHVYPTLTRSARKYLSILATSVPSERLFSVAGELISVKRNRIKPKNVNMFLFLNKYE